MKKALLLVLVLITASAKSQTLTLVGSVKDQAGQPIPFSAIQVTQKTGGKVTGVAADLDGNFAIQGLQQGAYLLEVSSVGFVTQTKSIDLKGGENRLDIRLLEDKKMLSEVVVSTVAKKETSTAVVSTLRAMPVVADGISTEFIKKTPDRTVGDALKRVSGITVQNDRFVLVRGLADRYNSAQLNSTALPSTEPDRRAFSFDIIPTSLIDNIIVIKSASADLQGDFSGGIIAVTTKEVEGDFTSLSLGTSWGSVTTLSRLKLVESIGFPASFPSTYTYRVAQIGDKIRYTKSIESPEGQEFNALPNANAGFAIGKDLGKLKVLMSSNIRNSYSLNYTRRKDYQSPTELAYDYYDTLSSRTTNVNALLNLTYLGDNKYSWKTVFSQQNNKSYLSRSGENYDNLQNVLSNSSNHFKTTLINSQLEGVVKGINVSTGWNFIRRTQPDYRVNPIVKSLDYEEPYTVAWRDTYRFWSVMNENSFNFKASKELGDFKLGAGYTKRLRQFNARVFRYNSTEILDEITNNTDRYDANANLTNAYVSHNKTFGKWKLNSGLRAEGVDFKMNTADFSGSDVVVRGQFLNLLPSANLSYNLTDHKFRFSASRTVSRPELREVANFAYYDFVRNAQILGNPNLKPADIVNLDLKWEWYTSKSESVFLSLFGKKFFRPIEQIVADGSVPSNLLLTYKNPNSATLYGIEIELKKNINDWLNFYSNTALMKSQVEVAGVSRSLQGQSNYVINGGFNMQKGSSTFNLSYNRIGERISAVGFQGYPDIMENSRDLIDITYLKKIGKAELKLSVNDLLAQPSIYYQQLKIRRKLIETNNEQTISITLNYKL